VSSVGRLFVVCVYVCLKLCRLLWENGESGPSRARAGPEETFSRGPSGEKIFESFFSKWCILVYFIFPSDGEAS